LLHNTGRVGVGVTSHTPTYPSAYEGQGEVGVARHYRRTHAAA
jgi:hypothetical protein